MFFFCTFRPPLWICDDVLDFDFFVFSDFFWCNFDFEVVRNHTFDNKKLANFKKECFFQNFKILWFSFAFLDHHYGFVKIYKSFLFLFSQSLLGIFLIFKIIRHHTFDNKNSFNFKKLYFFQPFEILRFFWILRPPLWICDNV